MEQITDTGMLASDECTGASGDMGLGVSGSNPINNGGALEQTEQVILEQDVIKTTTILDLPVSGVVSNHSLEDDNVLPAMLDDKAVISAQSMPSSMSNPPTVITVSNGLLHSTSSSPSAQMKSNKQQYSPSSSKVHVRTTSSNYHPRGQGHTPRGAVLPNSMYYRYIPVQVPTQPAVYYQQASAASATRPHHQQPGMQGSEQLSSTNLYIRGLSRVCSDDDLMQLCKGFGRIVSTKSILDKNTSLCKGYGFVDFESPGDALRACQSLQAQGIIVQFAKVPQQDQDPTNLYMSNLPPDYDEKMIEGIISPYGKIVSTRILRDHAMNSRGVGFARMDSKESCDKVIEVLNGAMLPGGKEPLMIKFADSSSKKKQSQNRWRDVQQQQYIYEAPQVISQNGLVGSRGIVQPGVFTAPYVQTSPQAIQGYQVPVSNISSGGWPPTAYFVQPTPGVGSNEGVHALSAQMGGLQISSTTGYATVQQPSTQYHFSNQHGTQYTQQTPAGNWTIPAAPTATYLQQDHSGSSDLTHTSVADSSKGHHVQVITQGGEQHTSEEHGVHLYYPTSTWAGK